VKKKISVSWSWSLRPRFRIARKGEIALGPGKVELLSAIDETHSLNQAAKKLGMSYMRAWLLVRKMNESFCEPLVDAERGGKKGGSTELTATGRRVLELYLAMEASALKSTARGWRELEKLLQPSTGSSAPDR